MGKRLLALLLVIVTSQWLFFSTNPNFPGYITIPWLGTLSFTIVAIVSHLFLYLVYSPELDKRRTKYALAASAISLLAAGLAFTKGSFIDQFLLTLTSVVFSFITAYLLALNHSKFGAISEIVTIPVKIGLGWYKSTLDTFSNIWTSLTKADIPKLKVGNSAISTGLVGAIITIPVVLVLVALLSSADPVFAKLTEKLFTFEWFKLEESVISRSVLLVLVTLFSVPFLGLKIASRYVSALDKNSDLGKLPGIAYILSISVTAVITAFLVIQFKYLFANVSETDLIQFGVKTYSEYVRRGFSELLLVSLVIYAVSGFSFVVYRAANNARFLRLINFILLSEAAIFIFSIFRRIYLYQHLHGFTRVRLYGAAFLVLLIVLTAILAIRHYKDNVKWYLFEVLSVVLFVFLTTGIGIDSLIVNYSPPTVNGEVDYVYIARLSADSHDGWVKAYNHAKTDIENIRTKPLLTDDDKRRVIYASYIFGSIRRNFDSLEWKSGNQNPAEIKDLNLAEQKALNDIKQNINSDELNTLINQTTVLLNQVNNQEYFNLIDRGVDAPLTN